MEGSCRMDDPWATARLDECPGTSIPRHQNHAEARTTRYPCSGGPETFVVAAVLPLAGSRMNRTPVAEIPMKLSARTAKAREPTASVRAPPRIGPMMRPDPKMIE